MKVDEIKSSFKGFLMEDNKIKKEPKFKRIVLKLSGEALRNTVDGDPLMPNLRNRL